MNATEPRAEPRVLDLTYFQDFTPARLAEIELRQETSDYLIRRRSDPGEVSMVITSTLAGHMSALDLGVYQDRADNLLIGSVNEALHPHDRWLYQAPVSRTGNMHWYDLHHHQPLDRYAMTTRSTLNSNLPVSIEGILKQVARMGLTARINDYWQLHHVSATIGFPLQPILANNPTPPGEMHDLLFHYRVWAQRNPQFAELPRDIVRRMHGLGSIVAIGGTQLGATHTWDAYHLDISAEEAPGHG